jgi:hypothetical protein
MTNKNYKVISAIDDKLTRIDDKLTRIDDNLTRIDDNLTRIDDNLTRIDDNLADVTEGAIGALCLLFIIWNLLFGICFTLSSLYYLVFKH